MELLEKLANNIKITDKDIENELYEMCDRVHSNCYEKCIIYRINNGPVNPDKEFEENRGCDCFKSGSEMLKFIRNSSSEDLKPESVTFSKVNNEYLYRRLTAK